MMHFTSRFLVLAITKAKADFFANRDGITVEEVEKISQSDPTPSGSFTSWLCNIYKVDKDMALIQSLAEPLKGFIKICNNPEFPKEKKDIGQYTPESLLELTGNPRNFRKNLSQKGLEKLIMDEGVPGAELVWNARGFKMWKVSNPRYARFLSSNTSWCTAQFGYSNDYCSKGFLYPVYFKNKPLAQGYQSESDTSIQFLNKEDHEIELSLPEMQLMLETIDLPVMKNFEVKTLNSNRLDRLLSEQGEQGIEAAKKLSLHSGNQNATFHTAYWLARNKKQWWIEGLETLLDSPARLKRIILETPVETVAKIKEQNPALAKEICYEFTTNQYFEDRSHMGYIMALGGEISKEIVDAYVQELLSSPTDFGEVPEITAGVAERAMRQPDSTMVILLEKNSNNPGLVEAAMYVWREFKHKAEWKCPLVTNQPEYQQRMEEVKAAVKKPVEGMKIVPGPDYTESVPAGTIGTIIAVRSVRDGYDVDVEWETGDIEYDLMTSSKLGFFSLSAAPGTRRQERISVKITNKNIEIGDSVTPSDQWSKTDTVPMGSIGTVTDIETGDSELKLSVDWTGTISDPDLLERYSRRGSGFFAYRFNKLMDVDIDTEGRMYDQNGDEVDKNGKKVKPPTQDTEHFAELENNQRIRIGGRDCRVRDGVHGYYLEEGEYLIAEVLNQQGVQYSDTAKHGYAEEVSGEASNTGCRSPELSLEGLTKLANALYAALGE